MISLCKDYNILHNSLLELNASDYLKHLILMYLKAYGAEYNFAEFYIESVSGNRATAVILRYNSFVYCAASQNADIYELSHWLNGFADTTVYSDIPLSLKGYEALFEMSKVGARQGESEVVLLSKPEHFKEISNLINKDAEISVKNEFFLDISHLYRHDNLDIFGFFKDNKLLSFAAASKDEKISVISFVFTEEYFRGNGFSQKVLAKLCSDSNIEYRLFCKEDNVKFYEKCGFAIAGDCCKYNL